MPRKTRKKKHNGYNKTSGPILKELSSLGLKVEGALKRAIYSKHAHAVQEEIIKSVRNIGRRLHSALEAAAESEDTREVKRQARRVYSAGKRTGTSTTKRVQTNLATGLRTLARELADLAGKLDRN